jgi:hypothetical protein
MAFPTMWLTYVWLQDHRSEQVKINSHWKLVALADDATNPSGTCNLFFCSCFGDLEIRGECSVFVLNVQLNLFVLNVQLNVSNLCC